MNPKFRNPRLTLLVWGTLLCACTTSLSALAETPPAEAPAADAAPAKAPPADQPADAAAPEKPTPAGQTRYKWSKATEAEVAAKLDKKFEEAAKQFVQLKRNDQLMFCKRYRDIGSNIPTLHCITEAELRKQVEDSDQLREQMRNRMGKCDLAAGCGAGS